MDLTTKDILDLYIFKRAQLKKTFSVSVEQRGSAFALPINEKVPYFINKNKAFTRAKTRIGYEFYITFYILIKKIDKDVNFSTHSQSIKVLADDLVNRNSLFIKEHESAYFVLKSYYKGFGKADAISMFTLMLDFYLHVRYVIVDFVSRYDLLFHLMSECLPNVYQDFENYLDIEGHCPQMLWNTLITEPGNILIFERKLRSWLQQHIKVFMYDKLLQVFNNRYNSEILELQEQAEFVPLAEILKIFIPSWIKADPNKVNIFIILDLYFFSRKELIWFLESLDNSYKTTTGKDGFIVARTLKSIKTTCSYILLMLLLKVDFQFFQKLLNQELLHNFFICKKTLSLMIGVEDKRKFIHFPRHPTKMSQDLLNLFIALLNQLDNYYLSLLLQVSFPRTNNDKKDSTGTVA